MTDNTKNMIFGYNLAGLDPKILSFSLTKLSKTYDPSTTSINSVRQRMQTLGELSKILSMKMKINTLKVSNMTSGLYLVSKRDLQGILSCLGA